MSHLLVYTMTGGLGDYFVIGDLIRKAEEFIPGARCVVIHRGNQHVKLWPWDGRGKTFFDFYSLREFASFISVLGKARHAGAKVFGLQMAPGSMQGFVFYAALKRLGFLDFIVDFNLINADIITPPKGDYILDLHLNQLALLFQRSLPIPKQRLQLPLKTPLAPMASSSIVGLHPWTRRNNNRLTWPLEHWLKVVEFLLDHDRTPLLFGRDPQYAYFKDALERKFGDGRVIYRPSSTVEELVRTIGELSLLISLNSSVIHAAYALGTKTVVLSGPHLDFWTPKHETIREVRDLEAIYPPSDESKSDPGMPMVSRITVDAVISAVGELLNTQGRV